MLHLNEEIPSKFLHSHSVVPNAEIICIKFDQSKRNWLLLVYYKPPFQNDYYKNYKTSWLLSTKIWKLIYYKRLVTNHKMQIA